MLEIENSFLSAYSAKGTNGDEKLHLILQLPQYDPAKEYLLDIPQAGVIDFDKNRVVMVAFLPKYKFVIYACEFSNRQEIPWDSINASLRASEVKKDDELTYSPIQITSPSSPDKLPFSHDKSSLIRLDILLRDTSWIHFILNGQEIGTSFINTNHLGEHSSGHVNLFPIVRGMQNFKVLIG